MSERDQGTAKYQMLNTKIERTNMNPIVPRVISRFKIRDFKSLYLYFFSSFKTNYIFSKIMRRKITIKNIAPLPKDLMVAVLGLVVYSIRVTKSADTFLWEK